MRQRLGDAVSREVIAEAIPLNTTHEQHIGKDGHEQ